MVEMGWLLWGFSWSTMGLVKSWTRAPQPGGTGTCCLALGTTSLLGRAAGAAGAQVRTEQTQLMDKVHHFVQ